MTKRHFLKKNNLIDSYIFVGKYNKFNVELRGVIIQTLVDKYNSIFERKDLDFDIKTKLLSEIELEIMCKVMELTESLASISYALTEDETKIKENIVDFNEKQGLTSKNFYKNVRRSNGFYYKLFTYPEVNSLPITIKEKKILRKVYSINMEVVKELYKMVRKFRKFNMIGYNKNRHSRPLLIGFPINDRDYYAFSGVISRRNTKSKKIINTLVLHGKPILDKYVDLAMIIIQLQKDLLWNRILYFECDGFKIPIQTNYFELSDSSKSIVETINEKCKKSVIRNNIKPEVRMNIKTKIFTERINFYKNEFKRLKKGLDQDLEKIASKNNNQAQTKPASQAEAPK